MEGWVYWLGGCLFLFMGTIALVFYRRMQQMQAMLNRAQGYQGTAGVVPGSGPATKPGVPAPQETGSPLGRLAAIDVGRDDSLDRSVRSNQPRSFDPALVTRVEQGEMPGLDQLENALQADPENVELLEMLAYIYYCSKDLDKSIASYLRAVKANPSNEVNHYYLANAYYLGKDPNKAIAHWGKVIEVNPQSRYGPRARERIDKVKQAGWVSVE
ncbi:MAG: tetratricopeptide repeat protein [Candidatus Riflebacteria bacterium]|nr:tetratricopeptide repeat protein [Candidatus Riflebacteria bacterium]